MAEAAKGVGRPKVGGPFQMVDQDGKLFTEQNLKGKYALVSNTLDRRISTQLVWYGLVCRKLTLLFTGLFWFHPLSRHMPGGTRQDGQND